MDESTKVAMRKMAFIDVLRGLAAVLVYVFHQQIHTFIGYPEKPIPQGSVTWWLFLGAIDLGKIAVAVFFCVSGYLIPSTLTKPGATIRDFTIHRIFRLYPAYWVSIASRLVILLALGMTGNLPTAFNLVANITMFQKFIGQQDMIGVFWTLQIELVFYIVAALLAWRKLLTQRWPIQLTMMLLTLVCAAGRYVTHKPLPVAMFMAMSLMWMADTLRASERGEATNAAVKRAVISMVIMLVPASLLGYGDEGPRYITSYLISIGIFVFCWAKRSAFEKSNILMRVLGWLGDWSYGIYLMHGSLLILIAQPLKNLTNNVWLTTAGTLPLLLLTSWLLYRFVEAPMIRIGKLVTKHHAV
jgi:peptidoglycan/LPS O-acetylase OafA/YrhL